MNQPHAMPAPYPHARPIHHARHGATAPLCRTRLSSAALVCIALAGAGPALAQSEDDAVQKIVVTGTSIRGAVPVGTPVMKLGRDEIDKSGAASTGDLLRQLPQIQNLGADESHTNAAQNANQNITLGSGINLRGLGPESTLTLVNGQRLAPGGLAAQYTDPSAIPPLAIDRIEVITDGGSSTYGSDAVGGVVNIRLRKNFQGTELTARRGDADGLQQNQAGIIAGRNWDGGNAMLALDANRRSRLDAGDRAYYTDDMRPWGGPDLRGFNASPGNIQVGSTRYAIPAGQNGKALTAAQLAAGSPNLQSIYKGIDALPQQQRVSVVGTVSQALSESMNLELEGFASERKYERRFAALSASAVVRKANPFFVSPVAGATTATVNYSFINDLGVAQGSGLERTQRMSARLNFDLAASWSGNAYAAHSSTRERALSDALNSNALNTALADTNPATALNVYCDGASFACNNPATLAKLRAYNDRNSYYKLDDVGVKVDGPALSLPAGKLRVALGGEVHRDKMDYFENRNNSTPDNSTVFHIDNGARLPQRTVSSLYAEAYVPLVGAANALTGVQKLDLSLALRSDKYSDFGYTTNPKVGLDWTPAGGVKLHATYGTSFRAPTLGDVDEVNAGLINVVDRVAADGKTMLHGLQLFGGREGLKPETARISTLGANLRPVSGLNLTLDYFNVSYDNRILTPGNDVSIFQKPELAPYLNKSPSAAQVAALLASPTYTGSLTEPVAGISFIADGRRYNAGVVKTDGLDLNARYDWRTGLGDFNAGLFANYIFNYRQQFTPTTALVGGLLNTLNNPVRLRMRGELGWEGGDLRVNGFVNYTNAYVNSTLAARPEVPSYTTLDLTAQYALGRHLGKAFEQLRATFALQNLFDRTPPYVQNATLAFDPQNVNPIGRQLSLTLAYKF